MTQKINKSFAITSVVEKAIGDSSFETDGQYIEVAGYASRMYLNGDFVIDADRENIDTFGIDLTRLKNGILPLLYNHNQDKVVGSVTSATYDKDGLLITAKLFKFPDDDLTNHVYHAVKNKAISSFSVGILVKDFAMINQDGEDYLQLAESEAIEISLVSVPSNPEALFRITSLKSADGTDKMITTISKSALKVENSEACQGLECMLREKHIEPEVQKEEDLLVEEVEKETIVGVTPEAIEKLEELQNPTEEVIEEPKVTEGETVTPMEDTPVDKSNDKPSEQPKDEAPVDQVKLSLETISQLDTSNMQFDELEAIYEVLAKIADQIEEQLAPEIAKIALAELTVTAPAV